MLKWIERVDGDKTIREATYQGYALEVTAVPVGNAGDFAATVYRLLPHGGSERDNQPHWGKSAGESLDRACWAAKCQVDADVLA